MTASIHDKIGLAKCFGELLQTTLTAQQFAELVERNAAHDPLSPVCFSHDYCDANMVMLAAWQAMFGGEFPLSDDMTDAENETNTAIFNEAWAIARSANFYA